MSVMYNYKIEASTLIGAHGIDLYFNDDEIPAQTVSLPDAIKEFLETYTICDVIIDPDAVKNIREQLIVCVAMIDKVLENGME